MEEKCYEDVVIGLLQQMIRNYAWSNPVRGDIAFYERGKIEIPPETQGTVKYSIDSGILFLESVSMTQATDCVLFRTFMDNTLLDTSEHQIMTPGLHGKVFEPPRQIKDEVRVEISNLETGKTRLTRDITSTETTIPVISTADFPASGTLQIGQEKITYTGRTATSFTGCTRGFNRTTAIAHAHESFVYDFDKTFSFIVVFQGWNRQKR